MPKILATIRIWVIDNRIYVVKLDIILSLLFTSCIKILVQGVLYHRWNKYDKAEEAYRKALKLNPRSSVVKDNLKKLNNIKLKRS